MNRVVKPAAASWLQFFARSNQISSPLISRKFSGFSVDLEPESWKSTEGLLLCPANYAPLSPINFLERAAKVYGDRNSVVYGGSKYTWRQTHERCLKIASALSELGVSSGDVVATLAPNVPAMYEVHFAVPMAGAVLCPLNTRLDSATVSIQLKHSGAKVVIVDHQLLQIAQGAFHLLSQTEARIPTLVLVSESNTKLDSETCDHDYEALLAAGEVGFEPRKPKSEWDPISLNYTSGTTSGPKGVVYSHRGAYLNAIATVFLHDIGTVPPPVYLWTVPMFHCNGWCLPWGVAALGGTNVCLRKVCPRDIFESIALHKVTHMGGAPTVLSMIVNSRGSDRMTLPHKVVIATGGSPPPPPVLEKMEDLGFSVTHLYGLTETYGPGAYCTWKPEWDSLPPDARYKIKARQGVQHLGQEDMDVRDPETLSSVPGDGKTIGEVMFRGNTMMLGYLKDLKATEEAFKGGWFRTGDLAIKHPDGYIEMKDRSKDIVISGGENISTVDVETALYGHPAVLEAAVVGRPDEHWGQTPCAFVKLKEGFDHVDAQELIKFCRDRLPHYMAPKTVLFEDLPRTATGKVQKFVLREKAKALG